MFAPLQLAKVMFAGKPSIKNDSSYIYSKFVTSNQQVVYDGLNIIPLKLSVNLLRFRQNFLFYFIGYMLHDLFQYARGTFHRLKMGVKSSHGWQAQSFPQLFV